MATTYLVVEVISADIPSSSNTSQTNYSVELHFNSQSKSTTIKENVAVWNERFSFDMRQREDPSGNLILEAAVYCFDQMSNSKSLLGKVLLPEKYFHRHSANVDPMQYTLDNTEGVNAKVLLKLFLTDAVDRILLETEDRHTHQTEGNGLNGIYNYLFQTNYGYGKDQHDDPVVLETAGFDLMEINPNFEPGRLFERMQLLFVRVIKARKLPDMDANGSLDPYVEVKFGAYNRGVTRCFKRNKNPEWNETFAFSFQHDKIPSPTVDIVVNDKDLVRDDFVGKLHLDLKNIPKRSLDDVPLEPTWYPLLDQDGTKLAQASLLLAIWIGSQADEAYRHVGLSGFRGLGHLEVGKQRTTSGSYEWKEDLLFVAAEPFFEDDLELHVIVANPGKDEVVIGQQTVPLSSIVKGGDEHDHFDVMPSKWFDLKNPDKPQFDSSVDDGNDNSSRMRICLKNMLDGRYRIVHDSKGYMDDTRPADRKLWRPPVGRVHLGILRATGLPLRMGKSTVNPYCVAKYGDKWVRTRTILDGPEHVFNEQHTWSVYDIATVLTAGVFDHFPHTRKAHREIGKVQIHLSCLETDRVYAHSYPLIILNRRGFKKAGELQIAVKLSSESFISLLGMYARSTLPKMHYEHPLTVMEEDKFRSEVAEVMALRFSRVEPPLRSEIVAYMCNATGGTSCWSSVHPDEIDEEFDSVESSCSIDLKVLVGIAGFYIMRHPRFRKKNNTPSIVENFFRRLPDKQVCRATSLVLVSWMCPCLCEYLASIVCGLNI
uniref:C2 domain containing protein n=1 Tax=Oryza sativa subsp. japonica TaxID=39947 RepID=Q2QWP5_ORYSJ|nr:C2 domain containing protein [Oryza sativa Japonica Group]